MKFYLYKKNRNLERGLFPSQGVHANCQCLSLLKLSSIFFKFLAFKLLVFLTLVGNFLILI